ncbi:MAG: DUF302 domain-containing protein [Bacteroidales bacterium]|nr:DUF302 domain-containing protein [Bacteroidales bacterium]
MKNNLTSFFIGIVTGIILILVLFYIFLPGFLIKENQAKYSFEETAAKFEEIVVSNNWKIPIIHDLQATMLKFGKEVQKVKIYEICQPDQAYKILTEDDERIVSSLMPCRIAIYEKSDGNVYISRLNSGFVSKAFGGVVADVMSQVTEENESMLKNIVKE